MTTLVAQYFKNISINNNFKMFYATDLICYLAFKSAMNHILKTYKQPTKTINTID